MLGQLDDDVAGQWQDAAKINSSRLVRIMPKSSTILCSNSIIELRPQSTKTAPQHHGSPSIAQSRNLALRGRA